MGDQESKRIGRQLDEITPSSDDLIALAERELAAFAAAVKKLFGPEQEHVSATEWICELVSSNWNARQGKAMRSFGALRPPPPPGSPIDNYPHLSSGTSERPREHETALRIATV